MAQGLDVSRLGPIDTAAAARSFARRFRTLLAPIDGGDRPGWDDDDEGSDGRGGGAVEGPEQRDELAHRPGPDGSSALDHAVATVLTFDAATEGMRILQQQPNPAIAEDATGTTAQPGGARGESIDSVLETLDEAADAFARAISQLHADGWAREIKVGNHEMNVLDMVRQAVAAGADHLRQAERAMAEARHSPR